MNYFIKNLFYVLLFSFSLSCSIPTSRKLIRLPVSDYPYLLDSSQADIIYKYAKHFPEGTQLSICIITPDSEKYAGILIRNDSLIYIDNSSSIFEIGSITKTFTGTILAKLVYDKRINLNDPIQKFLPFKLKQNSLNGEEIKIVNLAGHTSGLPREPDDVQENQGHRYNPYNPYDGYNIGRLYNYLSNNLVLQSTPGEKRSYSNLGYGLLGHLLTLITRKSYEELLMDYITGPVKMGSTFVKIDAGRIMHMVRGRNEKGEVLPYFDWDSSAFVGAGGIKSSAKDLAKYIKINMTDTAYFFLAQKSIKKYSEYLTQGLGWATFNAPDSFHHVSASGATGGYTCGLIFERNVKVGVVVLTNVSAFLAAKGDYIDDLCRELYDQLPFKYSVIKHKL
ncbi:MAG TPA: serine hydrolase domain-containing protein [Ignavibacteriaceae bacterium]|nr:serine hydrolase domain-containing protein [Ignavibacteriaceae bacterium]